MAKYRQPEWLDEFAQRCPHVHFKTKTVDRDFLTRKQHLNLLCTPRGYRWEVAYHISMERSQEKLKNLADKSKSKFSHPKAYVYNILAELWSIVTPEMIERLKAMLMEEFGIPEDQAVHFMCKQVQETLNFAKPRIDARDDISEPEDYNQLPLDRPRVIQLDLERARHPCKPSLDIKPKHVKHFSEAVSKKLAELLTTSMCSKRTKKHKIMSNFLLESLCQITGDHCTMESASTTLQKAQTFLADKITLWILRNTKNEDALRTKARAEEDDRLKKKIEERFKEKQEREKERIRLAKKLENQRKAVEKINSDLKDDENLKKTTKIKQREEKHAQWLKRDEENKKEEERKRKEKAAKEKQEQQEKKDKEAKRAEEMAKESAARKKRHEENLAWKKLEEKRMEKARKRDSLQKNSKKKT